MDEKFLQEVRRQEQILVESGISAPETEAIETEVVEEESETVEQKVEPAVAPPDGQRTLFGGDV